MRPDNQEPQTGKSAPNAALDKFNLLCGLVAILLLSASLAAGQIASLKAPAALVQTLHYAGLAAMVLYILTLALLKKGELKAFAGHKNTRSGANIGLQSAAILGILVALNWFGTRHHARVDLTENKAYSLSEQSKKVVGSLKEPVNVALFVKKGDSTSENLKNLWKEYEYAGGDKLKLSIVDVDSDPVRARAEKITQYGTTVLSRGERKTTITAVQEQDLTSALLKVTQSGQKVVYFLTGHGELAYDGTGREGLSMAKDALEKQNYKLDSLSLFAKKDVPSDAALVVIPGPTKPFMPAEADALGRYIDAGGKVFLSLQPQADPKLGEFAKRYGITINDDLVLDPRLNVGDLASPAVKQFPFHTTTQGLQAAYFSGSRSLGRLDTLPAGVNVAPLVETSADAWGETNLMDRAVAFDAGKDHKGPLPLMLLAEKGKGKLIVSGNTNFMSNVSYANFNNGDLLLNELNWMADQENLVSIPPKDSQPKTVDLMPWQYNGIFFGTVLLMPLGLLLAAGFVWWRRR